MIDAEKEMKRKKLDQHVEKNAKNLKQVEDKYYRPSLLDDQNKKHQMSSLVVRKTDHEVEENLLSSDNESLYSRTEGML